VFGRKRLEPDKARQAGILAPDIDQEADIALVQDIGPVEGIGFPQEDTVLEQDIDLGAGTDFPVEYTVLGLQVVDTGQELLEVNTVLELRVVDIVLEFRVVDIALGLGKVVGFEVNTAGKELHFGSAEGIVADTLLVAGYNQEQHMWWVVGHIPG
jgi:hypothetical protein